MFHDSGLFILHGILENRRNVRLSGVEMITDYRIEKWSEAYPPNPAMLWLRLSQEGYFVQQWADLPHTFRGSQKLEHSKSHWVISGSIEINIEYLGRFILGPGDRDFMPADVYYTARVVGDEPVIYLVGELRSNVSPKPTKSRRGRTSSIQMNCRKRSDSAKPRRTQRMPSSNE